MQLRFLTCRPRRRPTVAKPDACGELLEEANRLDEWAAAWFWQVYRNQRDVYQLRGVLKDSAALLRKIAKDVSRG